MEDNPWYNIEEKYSVGNIVTGTVLRMVPFGVFVELEEGRRTCAYLPDFQRSYRKT